MESVIGRVILSIYSKNLLEWKAFQTIAHFLSKGRPFMGLSFFVWICKKCRQVESGFPLFQIFWKDWCFAVERWYFLRFTVPYSRSGALAVLKINGAAIKKRLFLSNEQVHKALAKLYWVLIRFASLAAEWFSTPTAWQTVLCLLLLEIGLWGYFSKCSDGGEGYINSPYVVRRISFHVDAI